jgi:2-iminoacetate synthase ThiH
MQIRFHLIKAASRNELEQDAHDVITYKKTLSVCHTTYCQYCQYCQYVNIVKGQDKEQKGLGGMQTETGTA